MLAKVIGSVVVIGIVSGVSYVFYEAYQPKPIRLQGEIDAQYYSVSSKVPGRIDHIGVKKGDEVSVGDFIFSINSPEVEAKLKQAKSAKNAAGALSKEADKGARKQQIAAAKDQWKRAVEAEKLLAKTYTRIEKLYKEGVLPEQKRDEVYTKYRAAQYQSSAAKQMYMMAKEGAREEQKEAARAQEEVYAGKVDEVNSYIKETKQYAFHAGEVSQILIHEGELAPTGFPVVTLVDINDSWAKFHVREDLLHYFKKGEDIELEIPALQKSYPFTVTHISVMGEYATWRAAEAGKGFDLKSFEVELRPKEPISGLRVGMSVLIQLP
jgi:HlyD family secretion protein